MYSNISPIYQIFKENLIPIVFEPMQIKSYFVETSVSHITYRRFLRPGWRCRGLVETYRINIWMLQLWTYYSHISTVGVRGRYALVLCSVNFSRPHIQNRSSAAHRCAAISKFFRVRCKGGNSPHDIPTADTYPNVCSRSGPRNRFNVVQRPFCLSCLFLSISETFAPFASASLLE
jgi:hypothetical protein